MCSFRGGVVTGLSDQKAAARKQAFAWRKTANSEDGDAQACAHLTAILEPFRKDPISAYMPIQTEIDPLPAMARHCRFGAVGVPVILGAGRPLEFHGWTPDAEMEAGPFGAKIPTKGVLLVPRVVVLPLVAFDRQGHRLGYGGGFYDRTLEILRAAGPVLAIGFAYSAQEMDTIPTEPTDQPLDAVVTENGIRHFTA